MGTNINYDDVDHQLIYDNINGGVGSQSLQDISRGWKKLADDVGGAAKRYVEQAIRNIAASREGAAAEAATTRTGVMLPWMDDVASIAHDASLRTQWQADHWVTAKNSVPPVPPAPASAGFFGDPGEWFAQKADWFPGLTTEEERAQQFQQDEAERARQAMRVYQSSSNGNLDSSLVFTAPQALDGSVVALSDPRGGGVGAGPGVAGGIPTGVGGQPGGAQPADSAPVSTAGQFALSSGGQVGSGGPGASGPGGWTANPTPGQGVPSAPVPFGAGTFSVVSELLARPAPEGHRGLTGEQLENRLTRGGTKPVDARSFAAMIRGPHHSGGKFGIARRDRAGKRHAAGAPLVYLATERGGYTLQPLRGPDGVGWTTLAPATPTQLARRVGQLLDGVRTG